MAHSKSILLLVAAPVLYWAAIAVYRLLFHPLAKVPGPKLLAISGLPKAIRLHFLGTWYKDVHSLHIKYGRVVRIGPNDIAVDGDPAWEECYSLRRNGKLDFSRAPEFFSITNDKTPSLPSIVLTDRNGHRRQRRILAHAFSNSAMYEQEPIIGQYVEMLIARIREMVAIGKPVDILKWYNFTTFDIIGDLTFGESFECLQKSQLHSWVAIIFESVKAAEVLRFLMQYPLTRWITNIVIGKKLFQTRADHQAFSVEKAKRRLALGPHGKERKDFMTYILKNNGEKGMTEEEIMGNSETLILAGSETTATALSGLTYYLTQNPHSMQILVDEIRGAFNSEDEITLKSASELVYAHACIEEGLRLFPPVAVTPPRVSPGDVVGGFYLPEGTRIAVHQWASHRNPQNWSRPHDFVPERFLPTDHPLYDISFSSDNKKCFRPFSTGPMDCIGKNLAYAELHLILAKMIWNFNFHLEPECKGWAENMKAYTLWDKTPLLVRLSSAKSD